MIFKSKYTNKKFFSKYNRDFFDDGYYIGLTYRKEIDTKIFTMNDEKLKEIETELLMQKEILGLPAEDAVKKVFKELRKE